MRIGYLGPLEVRDGGRRVEVPGRRLRALLTRLAVEVGRSVGVGALTDAVWADAVPADPLNALQSLVSRLRRTLADPGVVVQVPGGYQLAVVADDVDAAVFARLVARGHDELAAGSPGPAEASLDEALHLWRGEPLADDDSPDAHAVRIRLTELRDRAEVDRLEAGLGLGRAAAVLGDLEALLRAQPLREDLVLLRLRALVALGRPGEALLAYEATRSRLADELGTDPSPSLRAVHAELLVTPDPPVRALTNLRAPVTSFVGRGPDTAAVDRLLRSGRLVTVVGAGGSGKTRLASEVAATWVGTMPGGVWFVELAPVGDPESIALAVLDGLGVREVAVLEQRVERLRTTGRQRVLEMLGPLECVLVLDNCEHVVDAAATLVSDLLGRCPGVRVLATSREPLGVDGEQVFPLAPLTVPGDAPSGQEVLASPAVRLLLDRAAAAGAHLEVDATTTAAIVEVVQRLDGMPLAIELAAARMRVLPVAEVAARLSDRFRLLSGGRRDAAARHRTLRAVVAWSWELLTPAERGVAELFCVFGGSATVEAVTAVRDASRAGQAGGAGDMTSPAGVEVEDVLAALVDKSLLVVRWDAGAGRFTMLETLREYGRERLVEQGALEAVGRAHALWFADVAAREDGRLRGRDQLAALDTFDAERDNLLAALTFLGDSGDAESALGLSLHLVWFWMLRENGRDAEHWLRFVLAVPGADPSPYRSVAAALVVALALTGPPGTSAVPDWREPLVSAAEGLLRGVELPNGDRVGQLLSLLPAVLLFFGEQRERAGEQVAAAMRSGDAWVRTAARTLRTVFAENDGDLVTWRADVEQGLRDWAELGDDWGLAGSYASRAQLRTLDGDLAGAAADLEESRERARRLGTTVEDQRATLSLADLALRAGDTGGARRFAELLRADPRYDVPGSLTALLGDILAVSVALAEDAVTGDGARLREAGDRLGVSLAAAGEPSQFLAHGAAMAHATLVDLSVRTGDLAAAADSARTAHRLAVSTNDLPVLARTGVSTAALAAAMGLDAAAVTALGLADRLRGATDPTDPTVARLTRELTAAGSDVRAAHDGAMTLGREAAIRAIDPDVLLSPAFPSSPEELPSRVQTRRR